MMRILILTAVIAILLLSCGGNSGVDPNYPPTFTRDIEPLLNKKCAFSGCHGAQNTNPAGGPLNLTASNGNGYALIVNRPSFQMPGVLLVNPGSSKRSYMMWKLYGYSLVDSSAIVGNRMPLCCMPLTQAEIALISAWIDAGALKNLR